MKKGILVIVILIGLIVLGGLGTYNGFVSKQQAVDAAWAQVNNQYQRRADLVPNLVKTVQGSADFEKSVLKEVVEARASVGRITIDANKAPEDLAKLQEFQKAQGAFGGALQRLLVVAERYPDLKASASFRDLQAQLEGTENRISVERGRFNEAVKTYNTAIKSVPGVFFASMLGFKERPYFQAVEGAEKPPEVNFDFGNKPADGE
ncbi:MAG: LemA family protein [Akkermansiaceae bacterium]|nr:LemA family protein [Akkermansiaceae bacterium]MCP5548781.1 LemA family protein [Akkermansiaceae bacterium]